MGQITKRCHVCGAEFTQQLLTVGKSAKYAIKATCSTVCQSTYYEYMRYYRYISRYSTEFKSRQKKLQRNKKGNRLAYQGRKK